MLVIVFKFNRQEYAIDTAQLVAVLPALPVRSIPGAAQGIIGVFTFRATQVPVIDLDLMHSGTPCPDQLSTRILLTHTSTEHNKRLIGLRVEDALDTVQIDQVSSVANLNIATPGAPYLGRIINIEDRIIQLINTEALLSEQIEASLNLNGVERD
jgi:chemotaxis signal transduction protein